MAARRKKTNAAELAGHEDPRTPLDGGALLAAAKPLLAELAQDLLKRADESVAVTAALKERHAAEQKAERTAEGYPEWRRSFVEQVAAAWLLSCVFVRTLEDRGLLGKNRIAGAGAEDSWKAFLQLAPSLSEREYLLTVFRELSRLPVAADLFDVRHNPVWLLGPSAEGARKLLELFRSPTASMPAFRFGGEDTRFLGDLYQDVSEGVRKQYALLQTPRFVERFILDRTLDPAIERFGLNDTTLIDPTCGSGHFLLGAFERLFDAQLRAEPGLSPREAATKALDAIAGADINPYAIAIARFRLTLAFVEKCGIRKLKDAPRLPLHLAVADSLLYNPQVGQLALVPGTDATAWEETLFSLEDPVAARNVLFKQYGAVVGNPPYITVKDSVLRERYRALYPRSAAGKYSLAAPFAERFFQLGRDGASVGMITANSFMKREFGKRLIEDYLPTVNLELLVNTSGAYIPGHGTPTVLLFGTREMAKGTDILAVLASRGEPTTLEDAEKGLVWSSIAAHWSEVGFENEYISVAKVSRDGLAKHPWSLGGGGAGELKELLEERAEKRLGDVADDIGFASFTGLDDAFIVPPSVPKTLNFASAVVRPMVMGEVVRDWGIAECDVALSPYSKETQAPLPLDPNATWARFLWPYRTVAQNVSSFGGKSRKDEGQNWWEWYRWQADRYRAPFRIAFAFVATHNHFVLDRGGKVFKQSAPIIKLPETATEEDHLALLAYLNSSTACFWMKQVFHDKGSGTDSGKWQAEPAKIAYEFTGTGLGELPLPKWSPDQLAILRESASRLCAVATERNALISAALSAPRGHEALARDVDRAEVRDRELLGDMIAVQERIDWTVYEAFGLCTPGLSQRVSSERCPLGARPFEVLLARSGRSIGIDGQQLDGTFDRFDAVVEAIRESTEIRLIEAPDYKRRWAITPKNLAGRVQTFQDRLRDAATERAADICEQVVRAQTTENRPVAERVITSAATRDTTFASIVGAGLLAEGDGFGGNVRRLLAQNSVPYVAALRFSERGLEKHRAWQAAWELQRREDAGENLSISPPPHYLTADFRSAAFDDLRGKLDVPKERFISYPGCESDEDHEPVYGWAGWDHLQRAVALAGLYQDRKQREGWAKERLMPMLAGLLELLPWLKQWHNEPSADLGGERPSDQFEAFIGAECAEHGWTHEELRAWRPQARKRAKRASEKEMVES